MQIALQILLLALALALSCIAVFCQTTTDDGLYTAWAGVTVVVLLLIFIISIYKEYLSQADSKAHQKLIVAMKNELDFKPLGSSGVNIFDRETNEVVVEIPMYHQFDTAIEFIDFEGHIGAKCEDMAYGRVHFERITPVKNVIAFYSYDSLLHLFGASNHTNRGYTLYLHLELRDTFGRVKYRITHPKNAIDSIGRQVQQEYAIKSVDGGDDFREYELFDPKKIPADSRGLDKRAFVKDQNDE